MREHFVLREIDRRFSDAESTDADASIDRGARNRSKTVEKIIAFAICSPAKIDASRFSGPEQFFACGPYIFFKKSNVVFFDAESTDAAASIDRGARKRFRRRVDRCRCFDCLTCSKAIESFTSQCSFPVLLLSPPSFSPLSFLFFSSSVSFLPRSLHSVRTR